MMPLAVLVAPIAVGAAIAFTIHLLAPERLGTSLPLYAVVAYCLLVEINIEPLAGSTIDRLSDVALGGLAVGGAALLVYADRAGWRTLRTPTTWLLALLGLGLVLVPLSSSPVSTLQRSVVALAIVVAVHHLVRRCGYERTLTAVAVGAILLVVLSLAWEIVGPGTPSNLLSNVVDTGFFGLRRHQGLTSQPNQFGRICGTLVVVGAVLSVHSPTQRVVGYVAQVVGVVGLGFAQSRTGVVVTLAAVLLVYLLAGRVVAITGLVTIGLATGMLLWSTGAIGTESITRDGTGGGSQELTTATGRTALWAYTIDTAMAEPLFGVGAFATDTALAPAVTDGRIGFEALDAHNLFLNTLLAQGLVGLALLGGLIAAVARHRAEARAGAPLILLALAGLSMTEYLFWKPNSTLVLLAVALAAFGTVGTVPPVKIRAHPAPTASYP
ncbi:MAG: O-antigen ligase family protein [Acidimicrobiales bacterium]